MEVELLCPVCWEPASHTPSLPCRCRVGYCSGCWDRSLAESYNACGQARCPTCRAPVRVDFDAGTGQLVFTQEEEKGLEEELCRLPLEQRCRVRSRVARERLIQQARPAQVDILQKYGKAQPWLRTGAEGAASDPWSERCARAARAPPRCVCGGLLERLSSADRVRRVFRRHWPDALPDSPRFEESVARVIEQKVSFCSCDLCYESIIPPGYVWTCENGNQTILHANAYDICENCFIGHAAGDAELPVS